MLVLFNDPQSIYDADYNKVLNEVTGSAEARKRYVRIDPGHASPYLLHDATPDRQSTTDGRLRQVIGVRFKPETGREEMKQFEDAITALPQEISAIERLEWGTEIDHRRGKPKPVDPEYRNGSYVVLFTFAGTRQRDACLAHPAYKEFLSLAAKYNVIQTGKPADCAVNYEAHVEYIAQPD